MRSFLPIVLALNVAFVAALPAQDATPNRKGAEGLPRGEKGGGEGGAIADQPLIGLPRLPAAQLEAVERALNEEQRRLVDESVELTKQFALQRGQPFDATQARHLWLALVREVDRLAGDDIDAYLAARRVVLAFGPACRNLAAAKMRSLPAESTRRLRLEQLIRQFDAQVNEEKRLRVIEDSFQRLATARKAHGEMKTSRVAVLTARGIADLDGQHPDNSYYASMCYYSFHKDRHGYSHIAVSLEFGNGGDNFQVNMYGGQENRFKDMGVVDFAAVKAAPNAATTAMWADNHTLPAKVGHVYVEHCREEDGKVDFTVKFKVLDLKPGQWVLIEWEKIPQER